jgi:periodic tryptophan protein 1
MQVKFWDVSSSQPSLLGAQDMKHVGAVFSASFCADAPHLFAAGGAKGTLQVMDIRIIAGVVARYPQLMQSGGPVCAPVTGGMDSSKGD